MQAFAHDTGHGERDLDDPAHLMKKILALRYVDPAVYRYVTADGDLERLEFRAPYTLQYWRDAPISWSCLHHLGTCNPYVAGVNHTLDRFVRDVAPPVNNEISAFFAAVNLNAPDIPLNDKWPSRARKWSLIPHSSDEESVHMDVAALIDSLKFPAALCTSVKEAEVESEIVVVAADYPSTALIMSEPKVWDADVNREYRRAPWIRSYKSAVQLAQTFDNRKTLAQLMGSLCVGAEKIRFPTHIMGRQQRPTAHCDVPLPSAEEIASWVDYWPQHIVDEWMESPAIKSHRAPHKTQREHLKHYLIHCDKPIENVTGLIDSLWRGQSDVE